VPLDPNWTRQFLRNIGAPASPSNLQFLNAWWAAESGGGGGRNNPFNTTQPGFGGTNYNSVGVKNYPTVQAGAAATAKVLGEGFPHYTDILRGLRHGNVPAPTLAGFVTASPWGTHTFPGLGSAPSTLPPAGRVPSSTTGAQRLLPGSVTMTRAPGPDLQQWGLQTLNALASGSFNPERAFNRLINLMTNYRPAKITVTDPTLTGGYPTGNPGPTGVRGPSIPVQGTTGKVTMASGADRSGVSTSPAVINFASKIAGIVGRPLTIGTGSNHNEYVAGEGNTISDHWYGEAADIPALGNQLLWLGRAALIAAGMPREEALKQTGGVFNVGGYNILFNTNVGGNHYNHLHVGLGRILGRHF